jgi:signal transduction histidine kinase
MDDECSAAPGWSIYESLVAIDYLSRHNTPCFSLPRQAAFGENAPTKLKDNPRNLGVTMTEPGENDLRVASEEYTSSTKAAGKSERELDNEDERVRAIVAEYDARIDEVAELIARVRHEINNPLAGVLGQAQLLLREELNEKARKRAETIEELAIRLRDVVAQLRQVQKTSKG